ncbi:MAG TPA: hypothetical protein VEK10_00005, partial [Steroidobacteraceae bacterium]|nr:hypothetical protein [Steroidobacteraceae bacterium]
MDSRGSTGGTRGDCAAAAHRLRWPANNKRGAEAPMSFLTTRPVWVLIVLLLVFTALAMAGPVL